MARQIILGREVVDHFPVYEADGVTKKSGETVFTVRFWHEGVIAAPAYTIAEIGVTGEYALSFTPSAAGAWSVEVVVAYNDDIFAAEYDVRKPALSVAITGADDTSDVVFGLWGEVDGERVDDMDAMAVVIRDTAGTEVVDLGTNNTPTANGVFAFTTPTATLAPQTAYLLDVTATRGSLTWYAHIGFAKA